MNLFTVEEIRNYLLSQDSMGDALYHLSPESIIEANQADNSADLDEVSDGCPHCGSYEGDAYECPECGHGQ